MFNTYNNGLITILKPFCDLCQPVVFVCLFFKMVMTIFRQEQN